MTAAQPHSRTAAQAHSRTGGARLSLCVCAAVPLCAAPLCAQHRWSPEERVIVTDLSRVSAVAATQAVVYAATPGGLAVYDRAFRSWRETLGPADGFPGGPVATMVADPSDDAVWLGGRGRWIQWRPFGRAWDGGPLPGDANLVVLDARDPARGAYFRTTAGWFFVAKIGGAASAARDLPPPGRRLGPLSAAELTGRVPAFDVARLRIERDELLRHWPITAAAAVPITGELLVATDGNGVFQLDAATVRVERLPAGVLGTSIGAVALERGTVCVGSDDRLGTRRRGITCLAEDLSTMTYYEQGPGLAAMPGVEVRRVAVGPRAVWAATDQGVVRVDRRSRRVEMLGGADDLPSDDARALAAVDGGAWVGTTGGLVFVADSGRALRSDPSDIRVAVHDIEIRTDTLWLATWNGVLARPLNAPVESAGVVLELRVGGVAFTEPVAALGAGEHGVLAAARGRLVWMSGDTARFLAPAPGSLGDVTVITPDGDRFWVGGTSGLGRFRPADGGWDVQLAAGDLPAPVNDVAASRRYLWVATDRGLVRFDKSALLR